MKTIVKFTVATLLAMSAAAPAFAFNPEAQLLDERSMTVGQNQPYGSYAQEITAPAITVAPEAQLLAERGYQGQALNAHAEVRSWAGTRR
jgi:hypothetical protein